MEEKLQGIVCRNKTLEVNISKHPRKPPQIHKGEPRRQPKDRNQVQTGTYHDFSPHISGVKEHKTYAQVIGGSKETIINPPIVLNANTHMKGWMNKWLLIGESHSLDHIGTLYANGIFNDETKYLGGLPLAIQFGCSSDSDAYLKDKNRCSDWFKWVRCADEQILSYERTAWLKILSMPLPLWDENNFSKIASRFGKVIATFDNISTRRDYSMGKIGVLKSNRKWINEEIIVQENGVNYRVGVVEYTEDWSPFKPLPLTRSKNQTMKWMECRIPG